MRKFGLALAATALLMTSACGGDRPSVEEMSKSLKDGKAGSLLQLPSGSVNQEAADCLAKAIVDSDLSDDAVRALAEGDKKFEGDKDDTKAMTAVAGKFSECAKLATP